MCWVQVVYTMRVCARNRIYKSMNMQGTAHHLTKNSNSDLRLKFPLWFRIASTRNSSRSLAATPYGEVKEALLKKYFFILATCTLLSFLSTRSLSK